MTQKSSQLTLNFLGSNILGFKVLGTQRLQVSKGRAEVLLGFQ